ncbi:hypothetical protein BCF55_0326 [Hydrogenivirga caldilitoris]|uniref:Uncharacterized protein n=1 Tax=Hydrogenivirga caldilitoris TaxID=246264 RepID=A0A497XP37_9AQUI|nr:hypothetical protein [Hydrogenivirga caldilitoris]RLJ70064.1 hypothetical protein BCF55_0326 [Hydrogenivirga caldilitoris]
MLNKLRRLFGKREEEKKEVSQKEDKEVQETVQEVAQEEEKVARPLLPHELETFKKGMGITPHNYWTWASRTNNFKLLTDGEYVWVEGYEEHIGKQLPLTQQKAWSWEFIRKRLQDFGGEG